MKSNAGVARQVAVIGPALHRLEPAIVAYFSGKRYP